jgi:hypothetical protein
MPPPQHTWLCSSQVLPDVVKRQEQLAAAALPFERAGVQIRDNDGSSRRQRAPVGAAVEQRRLESGPPRPQAACPARLRSRADVQNLLALQSGQERSRVLIPAPAHKYPYRHLKNGA